MRHAQKEDESYKRERVQMNEKMAKNVKKREGGSKIVKDICWTGKWSGIKKNNVLMKER